MEAKRVTIKDIADRCGVTANTVSRALRNDLRISEATRQKVQQTADELGYIRNNLAATMRSGKSKLIAVIVDDIRNPHYATLIDQLDTRLKKEGYDIMTLCTHGDAGKGRSMVSLSVSNAVDGILYFPDSDDLETANLIRKNNVPFVLVDRAIHGISADVVRLDDYQGGAAAAKFLAEAGHKKFAYFCGPKENGAEPLRRKGFMEKLLQYGVKEADITVIAQDTIYSAIWNDSVFQVLQPEKYTGIFTFNDQIAYHIINALRENGYRVPEDFSIIGFDHIRGALAYLQPLTSVAGQDSERLAETTVSLLMRRIREPQQEYITEVLPVMLWEQESTVQPYF